MEVQPCIGMQISDFKQMYIDALREKNDVGLLMIVDKFTPVNLRMFATGKELKNDLHIYNYDIKDKSKVQAMIK